MTKDSHRPLPYYKWYWCDFRGNRGVQRLTYVERGLYRDLLDEQWDRGFVVDDIAELSLVCGCPESVMDKAWKKLRVFFTPLEEDPHKLANVRMEQERTESDTKRANLARAGRSGAIAKQMPAKAGGCHIEDKTREEKIREEEILNLLSELSKTSRRILKVDLEKNQSAQTRLKDLKEMYGGFSVLNKFTEWANSAGDVKAPLAAFLAVAEDLLGDAPPSKTEMAASLGASPAEFDRFLDLTTAHSELMFSPKNQAIVREMVNEYGADEVFGAWKQYLSDIGEDAYERSHAPNKFASDQGAAKVRTFIKKKKDREELLRVAEIAAEQSKAKALAENEEILRQQAEEAASFTDEI